MVLSLHTSTKQKNADTFTINKKEKLALILSFQMLPLEK